MGLVITYEELREKLKKGMRKGTWRMLGHKEKALYRAAMAYTKPEKGMARNIMNRMILEKLLVLIEKLLETSGMRVFKRGVERAAELIKRCEKNDVFVWAPMLKYCLRDPDYIFWLGTVR